ncbi:MAG: hypothetical protein H6619_05215 [Deltaproteobacteria bacterium]|nr:hypothetical protein [Deltaproteobacteria bacterium]
MKCRLLSLIISILTVITFNQAVAANNNVKVTVNLANSNIDDVDLLDNKGTLYPGTISNSKVKFTVPKSKFNGAVLVAYADGQHVGSVGRLQGSKFKFRLKGTPISQKGDPLTKVNIKLNSWTAETPYVTTPVKGKIFSGSGSVTAASIPNLGLNINSQNNSLSAPLKIKAITGPSADSDSDSVLDLFDVDADGDGIIDIADSSIDAGQIGAKELNTGVSLPFTTLYLNMPQTINWHIDGALDSDEIDDVIGGANTFAIAYYFGFSPDDELSTSITGAYAVCPDELEYCRATSVGPSTGIYSGFSEGDNAIKGELWSSLTASGQENSLESLNNSNGGATWAAAIQPRVGTDKFRPGDTYRVDFVNEDAEVVSRKSLTLPPYFLTVPAIRSYNVTDNDADNDVLADYTDQNSDGMNNSNPIVLASAGAFSGKLRLVIYRLQRLAVSGLEEGDYKDFGHLNYGIMINNNTAEYTCGELYEGLSSTLTELPSVGSDNSYKSSDGALLWPLVDSADDYTPSSGNDSTTIGNNTIALTVDLASCLDRNGLAPGTHAVTITAAGADTGHGANRAAQTIYVTIP